MNWQLYFMLIDFDGFSLLVRGSSDYLDFDSAEDAIAVAKSWADWIEAES